MLPQNVQAAFDILLLLQSYRFFGETASRLCTFKNSVLLLSNVY